MADILDVRTRKLADGRVQAIAVLDKEDENGDYVTLEAYGDSPETATEAVRELAAKA